MPPRLIGSTAESIYFSLFYAPGAFRVPDSLAAIRDAAGAPRIEDGPTAFSRPKMKAGEAWPWCVHAARWVEQPDGGARLVPGVVEFQVMPRGSARFWYVLRNDDLEFEAVRDAGPATVSVYVRLRARLIWSVGYRAALDYALELARLIFGPFTRSVLSRVDLTVDLDGWDFDPLTEYKNFVTRSRKQSTHLGAAVPGRSWSKGMRGTGIEFSMGNPVAARIYDKTEEITANSTKTWFYEIWRANGWRGGRVWRVEFQLRREALNEFGFTDALDGLDKFGSLFKYLTEEWLRLAIPDPSERRSRWETAPEWRALEGANFGERGHIRRARQNKSEREKLRAQFWGVATSLAAGYGVKDGDQLREFVIGGLLVMPDKTAALVARKHEKLRERSVVEPDLPVEYDGVRVFSKDAGCDIEIVDE